VAEIKRLPVYWRPATGSLVRWLGVWGRPVCRRRCLLYLKPRQVSSAVASQGDTPWRFPRRGHLRALWTYSAGREHPASARS